MKNNNGRVAIITARGGSKRIPSKNIKPFLGKPIISYSIQAAIESELFDEVMVSTDEQSIADIAIGYGAKVPFLRSKAAADDFATTADALLDVFKGYSLMGVSFEQACCIYPTAPFVSAARLREAYEILVLEMADAVFPVMPFTYPVQRAFKMNGNEPELIWPEHRETRSQDLTSAYHDAGQFYFFNVPAFLASGTLLSGKLRSIMISQLEGQDIDELMDWKLAEMKFQLQQEYYGKA